MAHYGEVVVVGAEFSDKSIPAAAYKGNTELVIAQIAEGVKTIGDYAFAGCSRLKVIIIPSSVINIDDTAFKDCDNIEFCINLSDFELTLLVYDTIKTKGIFRSWDELSCADWLNLLRDFPVFIRQCHMANEFTGWDWVYLLMKQPQFAELCDSYNGWFLIDMRTQRTVDEYDSTCIVDITEESNYRWQMLLENQPRFENYCDRFHVWERFDGLNWARLLIAQPSFYEKCRIHDGWRKIHEDVVLEMAKEERSRSERFHNDGECYCDSLSRPFESYYVNYDRYGNTFRCRDDFDLKDRGWLGIVHEGRGRIFGLYASKLDDEFWIYFLKDYPSEIAPSMGYYGVWNTIDNSKLIVALKEKPTILNEVARIVGWQFWQCLFDKSKHEDIDSIVKELMNSQGSVSFWAFLFAFDPSYYMGFINDCGYHDIRMSSESWRILLDVCPDFLIKEGMRFVRGLWLSFLAADEDSSDETDISSSESRLVERVEMCDNFDGWMKLTTTDWFCLLVGQPYGCRDYGHYFVRDYPDDDSDRFSDVLGKIRVYILDRCSSRGIWRKFKKEELFGLFCSDEHLAQIYIDLVEDNPYGWQTKDEAVAAARDYSLHMHKLFEEIEERHRSNHLQEDWKEVSGWNDLYGSDVDVSDIIEY